jgi:membrane dipeptidase
VRLKFSGATLVAAAAILAAGAAGHGRPGAAQTADRTGQVHRQTVFVDMHAHPSRFHRANVPRIEADELDRYRRGRIDLVVCKVSSDAIYSGRYVERDGTEVPARQYRPRPGEAFAFMLDRLARIDRTVADGAAVLATSPEAVLEAKARGRLALMPALEGADGLEGDLENLRALHRRGLRLVQIVHFRANELGHIQTYPYSPGGLRPFGRDVVREANRLGIVIDLAHANTETIMDTLQVSTRPVIFSHTAVKALEDRDRHLSDEEIRAIAAAGGVIGIWPNGAVLPRMDDMVRHIDYVKRLAGVDHVGIGSDLRGMGSYTEGFGEEANFLAIAEALLARDYSDEEVGKIMGGNFFRVWRQVMSR